MKKHDELVPPAPRRRTWTRAEDYIPPRRRRTANGQPVTARPLNLEAEAHGQGRPLLGLIPFVLLMIGLGVLAIAIAVAAWPGRQPAAPKEQAVRNVPGTAAPGWLQRR